MLGERYSGFEIFPILFDTLADLDNNGENFPHEQIRLTAIVPNWRRSVR